MRALPRRRRAFTFVELMFVVVILGVLAAIVAPRVVGGGQTTAIRTTARDMARLCAFARQSAISGQANVTLTIVPEEKVWYLTLAHDEKDERKYRTSSRKKRAAITDEEEQHTLDPKLSFAEVLRDGETLTDEEIEIVFFPQGTSSGATVVLETANGRKMSVHIEKATGLASAIEGEPKDFAQMLEEAGLDPTKYEGVEATEKLHEDEGRKPGEGFSRTAGSTEAERIAKYQDVATRIMARATARYEAERNPEKGVGVGGDAPEPHVAQDGQPAPRPPRMPKGATP